MMASGIFVRSWRSSPPQASFQFLKSFCTSAATSSSSNAYDDGDDDGETEELTPMQRRKKMKIDRIKRIALMAKQKDNEHSEFMNDSNELSQVNMKGRGVDGDIFSTINNEVAPGMRKPRIVMNDCEDELMKHDVMKNRQLHGDEVIDDNFNDFIDDEDIDDDTSDAPSHNDGRIEWHGQIGFGMAMMPKALNLSIKKVIEKEIKIRPLKALAEDNKKLELFLRLRKCYNEEKAPTILKAAPHLRNYRILHHTNPKMDKQPPNLMRWRRREGVASLMSLSTKSYCGIFRVLSEISEREQDWTPNSILDFGCGTGMALWAAFEKWGDHIKEYRGVDSSADMLELAEELMTNDDGTMAVPNVSWRRFAPTGIANRADIVTCTNTLSELPSHISRLQTLLSLLELTKRFLVIIEPSTKEGFKNILEARQLALRRNFTPVKDHVDEVSDAEWVQWEDYQAMLRSDLSAKQMADTEASLALLREKDGIRPEYDNAKANLESERMQKEYFRKLELKRQKLKELEERKNSKSKPIVNQLQFSKPFDMDEINSVKVLAGGIPIEDDNGTVSEIKVSEGYHLLEPEDHFQIYAPCPHARPCPISHQDMPCYFRQKGNHVMGQIFSYRQKKRGFVLEDFCYLVLERGGPRDVVDFDRLLSKPICKRKHAYVDVCTRAGNITRTIYTSSEHPERVKRAKKVGWGDLFFDEEGQEYDPDRYCNNHVEVGPDEKEVEEWPKFNDTIF